MIIRCVLLTAVMAAMSGPAFSETWSCERSVAGGKPLPIKWVVSGIQMQAVTPAYPARTEGSYRVVQNDEQVLLAFFKNKEKGSTLTAYVVIDKKSGVLIELGDIALTDKDRDLPSASGVGHCVQTDDP
jgi:hypothetical protein